MGTMIVKGLTDKLDTVFMCRIEALGVREVLVEPPAGIQVDGMAVDKNGKAYLRFSDHAPGEEPAGSEPTPEPEPRRRSTTKASRRRSTTKAKSRRKRSRNQSGRLRKRPVELTPDQKRMVYSDYVSLPHCHKGKYGRRRPWPGSASALARKWRISLATLYRVVREVGGKPLYDKAQTKKKA
jgi:hypothetical protein